MSGHWICEGCGYDGHHAEWCVCLRPVSERWKGHLKESELAARLAALAQSEEKKL